MASTSSRLRAWSSRFFRPISATNARPVSICRGAVGTDQRAHLVIEKGARIHVLGRMLKDFTGKVFILEGGGDVAPAIVEQAAGHDPGCAEKKIITALERYGEKMTAFAVVAHPADNYLDRTATAHVVLGTATGTYIAPCHICLAVGNIHKATLGQTG